MESNSLFKLWEHISRKETIVIAIDGNSYSFEDEEIKTLFCLNDFDQFEILYISSKNDPEQELESIVWCPYFRANNEIEIRKENPKKYCISGYDDPAIKNILSLELIAAISFGDLAVTKDNLDSHLKLIQKSFSPSKTYIGNLQKCFSALRAWINKQQKLSIKKSCYSYLFSNWTNIILHFNLVTPNKKNIYQAIESLNNLKLMYNDMDIREYFQSISTRIIHILNTRDILEVLKINTYDSTKRDLNSFSLNMTYYFGYLLILITGILDALGLIINWAIDRNIKKNYEVTLKKSKEETYKKFIKILNAHNKALADYIDSEKNQDFFELVYSIRNFIAHSIMPKSMRLLGNYQGLHGDLIYLDGSIEKLVVKYSNEAWKNISDIGIEMYKPSINPKDNKVILDSVLFTRFAVKEIIDFVDNIFLMLPLQNKITEEEERLKYNNFKTRSSSKSISKSIEPLELILSSIETQLP